MLVGERHFTDLTDEALLVPVLVLVVQVLQHSTARPDVNTVLSCHSLNILYSLLNSIILVLFNVKELLTNGLCYTGTVCEHEYSKIAEAGLYS